VLPDSLSGHAWIELHGDDGTVLLTIDITLDQFAEWNDWHSGASQTPALEKFTCSHYFGLWRSWPLIARNPTYATDPVETVQFLDSIEHLSERTTRRRVALAGSPPVRLSERPCYVGAEPRYLLPSCGDHDDGEQWAKPPMRDDVDDDGVPEQLERRPASIPDELVPVDVHGFLRSVMPSVFGAPDIATVASCVRSDSRCCAARWRGISPRRTPELQRWPEQSAGRPAPRT
jgi:hypothetical protein